MLQTVVIGGTLLVYFIMHQTSKLPFLNFVKPEYYTVHMLSFVVCTSMRGLKAFACVTLVLPSAVKCSKDLPWYLVVC